MNEIHTRKVSSRQHSPRKAYSRFLAFISILLFSTQAFAAQPMVFGPEQINRMRQLTTFSDDFSETKYYDLDNPITLSVTIFAHHIPEEGNAELIFTIDESFSDALRVSEDPDVMYVATMQMAQEAKRLRLGDGRFKKGLQARLTGWPANDNNHTPSILLIDEIELVRSGRKFAMHAENPKMDEKKAKKDKENSAQE